MAWEIKVIISPARTDGRAIIGGRGNGMDQMSPWNGFRWRVSGIESGISDRDFPLAFLFSLHKALAYQMPEII